MTTTTPTQGSPACDDHLEERRAARAAELQQDYQTASAIRATSLDTFFQLVAQVLARPNDPVADPAEVEHATVAADAFRQWRRLRRAG